MGGYRTNEGAVTRWGRFLRADLLGDIPAESVAALTDYGIHTAIDLRTSTELFEKPSVFARSPAIKYFNHNLLGDDELPDVVRDYKTASGMADGYAWILEERQLQIRRSFGTHSSGSESGAQDNRDGRADLQGRTACARPKDQPAFRASNMPTAARMFTVPC